ncbi:hypothetical protein Bandiella_00723 [Candidatus Bandiella woodruffii]|uniref:Uncharacterized protein n=1 Tax=Candidatus Bandiella euplotis TaxID=1664265 RepID=A0ABZ0UKF8_9RICK|nr:hypothetical protein Bandiella_00723 [Candidatus Bandiella woodruffii]
MHLFLKIRHYAPLIINVGRMYTPLVNQELMKFIDNRELGKERGIRLMSMRSVQKYVTKCEVRSILTPIFQVIGV